MIKRIGALVFALTLLFSFAVPASAAYDETYTYYDSLTANGSQYIDTLFQPDANTRVVVDFNFNTLSRNACLFGANDAVGANVFFFNVFYLSPKLYFRCGTQYDLTSYYDPGAINTLDVDLASSKLSFNGNELSLDVTMSDVGYNLFLFALNFAGSPDTYSVATIYSCRIYDNGNLVRSFIPATNSSGQTGMWDTVNNVFYGNGGSGSFSTGEVWTPPADEPTVAETIRDLNTQIHDIESTIYEDLHTYSAQVDPSTATNFSGNFLSAMSFISDTWTSAYNQLGDMQVIVTFPLFLAIAMLFIGRMNSVIASGAMKSRKNNDKKGGGDVG